MPRKLGRQRLGLRHRRPRRRHDYHPKHQPLRPAPDGGVVVGYFLGMGTTGDFKMGLADSLASLFSNSASRLRA